MQRVVRPPVVYAPLFVVDKVVGRLLIVSSIIPLFVGAKMPSCAFVWESDQLGSVYFAPPLYGDAELLRYSNIVHHHDAILAFGFTCVALAFVQLLSGILTYQSRKVGILWGLATGVAGVAMSAVGMRSLADVRTFPELNFPLLLCIGFALYFGLRALGCLGPKAV